MQLYVLLEDGYIIDIYFSQPTKEIYNAMEALNNNPLINKEYKIEERYSNKSLYELKSFLEIS